MLYSLVFFLYVFLSCFRNSCSFRFAMYSSFLVAVGKSLKFCCFNVKSRVTKSFSKVDFLSFYSLSTWKTTKKKIHDFGENFYILMYFTSFYLGAGTLQHPMYYCNKLGIWGYFFKVGTLILELDFRVFRSTAFWLLSPKNYTIYVFFHFRKLVFFQFKSFLIQKEKNFRYLFRQNFV